MESLAPCMMCGCTNYEIRAGFYVCAECNIQSQEYQEQSFRYDINRAEQDDNDTEVVLSQSTVKERELTSWECYNIILSGLLDELINMGASRNVKVIAFQLWVRYLQKLEAAFISKKVTTLPKLPVGFKNRDAKILYGVDNLRQKLFKNFLESSHKKKKSKIQKEDNTDDFASITHSQKRLLRKRQRQLATSELSNPDSASARDSECESLLSLSSLRSNQSKRIKIGFLNNAKVHISSAKKILEESVKMFEDANVVTTKPQPGLRSEISRLIYKARNRRYERQLVLSMSMLVCICQLSLYLSGEMIHLSDILRWAMEGKFSVNRPEVFLRDKCKAPNIVPFLNNTYHGIQNEIGFTASFLGISELPSPNLYHLVERYCNELQLPEDFILCVRSIISLHPPKMKRVHPTFPSYECRALGYILFAAKLLFSLNDVTERTQSDFAELYNRRTKDKFTPRLFCWKEWIKYIECRRVTLARFNYCLDRKHYNNNLSGKQNFVEYWNRTQPLYTIEKSQLSDVFLIFARNVLKNLNLPDVTENVNLPSSLNPQADSLDYLLKHHIDLIPERSRKILNRNFTSTTIDYLLYNDERFREIDSISVNIRDKLSESVTVVEDEFRLPPFYRTVTTPLAAKSLIEIDYVHDSNIDQVHKCGKRLKTSPRISIDNDKSDQYYGKKSKTIVDEDGKFKFNLYKHFKNYVFYHNCARNYTFDQFDELMERKFSFSFCWLLKECTALITGECKDVYVELMHIESTLYRQFVKRKYSHKLINFNKHDW